MLLLAACRPAPRNPNTVVFLMLPASHWAYAGEGPRFDYDPSRAERLLDEAGLRRGPDGVRFRLTMKTSTDEGTPAGRGPATATGARGHRARSAQL
jgi:peptide/nickel transport system substrate-binding protein